MLRTSINSGTCSLRCHHQAKCKGLCGQHYEEYRTQGLHQSSVVAWEINNSMVPCSTHYFKKRVQGIVRGVPLDRNTKSEFIKAMVSRYNGGSHE